MSELNAVKKQRDEWKQEAKKMREALEWMGSSDRIEERNEELERENEALRFELKQAKEDLDRVASAIDRFLKVQAPSLTLTNNLLACKGRE